MHCREILEKYHCTPARLREIFTSTGEGGTNSESGAAKADIGASSPEDALTTTGVRTVPYQGGTVDQGTGQTTGADPKKPTNWDIRRRFEYRIRSRVLTGIATGINNAKPLQAVDMAWDAQPIQKETVPLMLWAQGKIKQDSLCAWLGKSENCDPATAAKFVKKDAEGRPIINIPRICDIAINLPRSYVTRRHAALSALWDNLWPLLQYDPRGTKQKDQLNADVVTQLVDVMSDEYNYRHFLGQCDRDKLLYSASLIFPRAAWDCKKSWRMKKSNVPGSERSDEAESYITQEGVDCCNPHPSRWIYDLGAPLANINTNNGPTWIGYWDIVPFEVVRKGDYYNTNRVVASEAWTQLLQQYGLYFAQYFNPCVLTYPNLTPTSDPALTNDRPANIGLYSATYDDKGVLLTQYYEKINPKVEGIGDYDAEIWLRMTAAGDGTIVAAEFMPSIPACYGGINCNDNRVANASLASEMLAFQDQVSNILTTMNEQVRRSFTQLWVFNRDLLDEKIIKDLEANAANRDWWIDPKVLMISFSEKNELLMQGKFDPQAICFKIEMQLQLAVGDALRSIGQLLALADRLVNSSPNELGQPMPREVSAKETQTIETSIQSIYSFYNQGPREQRAAFKRLVYESMKCYGSDRFEVPVLGRYSVKTVEDAGFKVAENPPAAKDSTILPSQTSIVGSLSDVDFDCQFTSRDGMERPVNTQGAQVLQQLFQGMMQVPGVPQKLGPRRIFEMTNIIARMAGAPDEFEIALDDGESEDMKQEEPVPPQVQKAIQDVMAQMQQLAMKDAGFDLALQAIAQKLGIQLPQQIATPPGAPGQPGQPSAPGPGPAAAGASPAGPGGQPGLMLSGAMQQPSTGAPQPNGAAVLAEP